MTTSENTEVSIAEQLFGRKSVRHTHPATHPLWMEFADGDCIVCSYQPLPDPVHHGDIFARINASTRSQS